MKIKLIFGRSNLKIIDKMNKKNNLIRNTLILGLGKVSTQLISFLLLPLYTIFLSPGEYGTVDLIITYMALSVPAITIQLEMAAFRFLIDARDDEPEKQKIISNVLQIITPILITCLMLFAIANIFINIPYFGLILLIICSTIFSSLFLQLARGLGENKKFAVASILAGLVTIITNIIFLVFLHMGAGGMLLSIALANIFCCIYLLATLKIYKYINFKNKDKTLQKELIKYSFPLVPNGVSWWAVSVSDRTIISIVIGVAANGIYAIANKFSTILTGVFSIFSMSWTESASLHINSDDRDSFFSDIYNSIIKLYGSLGLIVIAAIPFVFGILVDSKFNEAYLYIPILIAATLLNAIAGLYGAIYIAKRMTKQVANTTIIAAVINVILTIVLIKFIGIYAAAIATAVAYLIMAVYRHYDSKKYVAITYEKGIFVKMAVLYALVMVPYYFNNLIGNILSVVVITGIVIILNRSILKVMKDKASDLKNRRQKRLTVEQELYEDSV